jgi:hypothetical protein
VQSAGHHLPPRRIGREANARGADVVGAGKVTDTSEYERRWLTQRRRGDDQPPKPAAPSRSRPSAEEICLTQRTGEDNLVFMEQATGSPIQIVGA